MAAPESCLTTWSPVQSASYRAPGLPMTEWLLLLAAVLLTAFTGFFVAAEFSLTTVDRGRAEEAARDGDTGAAAVVRSLRELSTELSAAQLGITLTTLV